MRKMFMSDLTIFLEFWVLQVITTFLFLDRDMERPEGEERRAERPQDHQEPPRRGRLPPHAAGKDRVSHTGIGVEQFFVYFSL